MPKKFKKEDVEKWVKEYRARKEILKQSLSPYFIPSNRLVIISFSGGRTSGLLLHKVIQANNGIPSNCLVVFRNTGKEKEETLDFVYEIQQRWKVKIIWLEYRYLGWEAGKNSKHSFVVVDYKTASRNGQPFDDLIRARNDVRINNNEELILPNQGMRWCTGELKQRTLLRYLRSNGHHEFMNLIGIRWDEPARWMKIIDCKGGRLTGETPLAPLFDGFVTVKDVNDFWSKQPFDLKIDSYEGNCDLCFLKARWKKLLILKNKPEIAEWWAKHEEHTGCFFRLNDPVRQLQSLALITHECLEGPSDQEEIECHCTD